MTVSSSKAHYVMEQVAASIRNDTATLNFQPIYNPADLSGPVGMEALIRFPGVDLNIEDIFVAVEHANPYVALGLGEWVIEKAVKELPLPVQLWINLSPHQLLPQVRLAHHLEAMQPGFSPSSLVFEITERLPLEGVHLEAVYELAGLGCSIALDDLKPRSHKSLARANILGHAASYLKLAGEFLALNHPKTKRPLPPSHIAASMEAAIDLAEVYGMKVVAEGVEDSDQHNLVCQVGCHLAQGHLYQPPKPMGELIKETAVCGV